MASLNEWGDLTPYMAYLTNRARSLELDPRMKVRFGESDLVQETFLKAQSSEIECRGTSPRERMAYLDKVFQSVFYDHLEMHRADKRDVAREQAIIQSLNESTAEYRLELADRGDSPSENAIREENFLQAMVGINQLPKNERDVVILTHLQVLSVPEAAIKLGIHRGSAARLYASAMIHLKAFLSPNDGV